MKEWQFNVLFWVAVAGTALMLVAPAVGLKEIPDNPGAVAGIGTILAYVLTQKRNITSAGKKDGEVEEAGDGEEVDANEEGDARR